MDDKMPGDRVSWRRIADKARAAATGAASYVADRRYERTPAGKARKAARRGASTFHIRLDLDSIAHRSDGHSTREPELDDVIGSIEAEGWALDQIEYLTETEGWEETEAEGVTRRVSEQKTFAVLLFRRGG